MGHNPANLEIVLTFLQSIEGFPEAEAIQRHLETSHYNEALILCRQVIQSRFSEARTAGASGSQARRIPGIRRLLRLEQMIADLMELTPPPRYIEGDSRWVDRRAGR